MSAIERAFSILEALAGSPDGVPLSELSRQLHLPKSSLHLTLGALIDRGYVRQNKANERYGLTMRLPALGFGYLTSTGMVNICQPVLDELANQVHAVVQLRIVDGDDLVRVAWAQGSRSPLRYAPLMQANWSLHNTGAGLAWLASLSETEAARIVLRHGFPSAKVEGSGRNEIRTLPELFSRLRKVKKQGYGLNVDGIPGVHAVAVPVKAGPADEDEIVATLSIAGLAAELTEAKLTDLVPGLKAAAHELSVVWPMHKFLTRPAEGEMPAEDAVRTPAAPAGAKAAP